MAKVKLKNQERKAIGSLPSKIKPKNNIASDTLFVSSIKDKRIKPYQDSLSLYNKAKKAIGNSGNSKKNTPIYVKKGIDAKELVKNAYSFVQNQLIDVSGRYDANMNPNNNFPAPKVKQKILPIAGIGINEGNSMGGWYDIYKKPTQPVVYKKPEPKQELVKKQEPKPQPIIQKEQPRPIVGKIQNTYEGSPVYSPGAGSGMPSALVGFRGKDGEVTYIKPEDYKRFAVPEYGKKFIESKNSK